MRLWWALISTRTPTDAYSDSARYLALARSFAHLDTERINGHPTAFTAQGYPALLSPVAWLSEHTGWFGLPFGASLLNVVLGTLTILGTAALARQWFGAKAEVPAAWLLALAPGQIYLVSAAMTETTFTALLVAVLLAATTTARRPISTPALIGFGSLVGLLTQVRFPGALLLCLPLAMLWRSGAERQSILRAGAWMLLGFAVLQIPPTVRNGTEVGVWTPTSSSGAAFLCSGHYDGSEGFPVVGPDQCYQGSPFDPNHVDEPAWYRRTGRDALAWMARHPVETLKISGWITYDVLKDDSGSLDAATDFRRQPVAGTRVSGLLDDLANAWYWGITALAVVALVLVPATRRALPLWLTALAMLLIPWLGIGQPRFHHPVVPIAVCFASALLIAAHAGRDAPGAPAIADG